MRKRRFAVCVDGRCVVVGSGEENVSHSKHYLRLKLGVSNTQKVTLTTAFLMSLKRCGTTQGSTNAERRGPPLTLPATPLRRLGLRGRGS